MNFLIFSMSLFFSSFSNAQSVLFIGDSHSVGPFGKKLDLLLREKGAIVETYASCGSIAQWWVSGKTTNCGYFFKDKEGKVSFGLKADTPIFKKLMDKNKPAFVIVELGANYANVLSDDFAVEDMSSMASMIKDYGAKCFWVTKPHARKNPQDLPRILELTYKAVSPYCDIFDSTKVTEYPKEGGDGIHYSFKEGIPIAENWAKEVFEWFIGGGEKKISASEIK
ncbi:MAG: SGNH/GDSL hydrolase family protein [Elusimicrobiota bacterium]